MMITRLAFALTLAFALPAFSDTLATGAEIKAALSGNTFQGEASDGEEAFIEFYAEDGTIKGPDYTGKWTIDGDTFCLAYEDEATECLGASISGDTLTWLQKDGSEYDKGKIVKGNPNKF